MAQGGVCRAGVQQQSHPRKDHGGQPGSSRRAAGSEGRGLPYQLQWHLLDMLHADNPLALYQTAVLLWHSASSSSCLCMAVGA